MDPDRRIRAETPIAKIRSASAFTLSRTQLDKIKLRRRAAARYDKFAGNHLVRRACINPHLVAR
jgi:hypothetical protein